MSHTKQEHDRPQRCFGETVENILWGIDRPRIYLGGDLDAPHYRKLLVPDEEGQLYKGRLFYKDFIALGPFEEPEEFCLSNGVDKDGHLQGSSKKILNNANRKNDQQLCRRISNKDKCLTIESCELFFAYISSRNCHHAIFEFGYALAHKRKSLIVFGQDLGFDPHNAFPFVSSLTNCLYDISNEELPKVFGAAFAGVRQ